MGRKYMCQTRLFVSGRQHAEGFDLGHAMLEILVTYKATESEAKKGRSHGPNRAMFIDIALNGVGKSISSMNVDIVSNEQSEIDSHQTRTNEIAVFDQLIEVGDELNKTLGSLNVLNVPSLQKIARLGVAYISSKMLEDFEKEVKGTFKEHESWIAAKLSAYIRTTKNQIVNDENKPQINRANHYGEAWGSWG